MKKLVSFILTIHLVMVFMISCNTQGNRGENAGKTAGDQQVDPLTATAAEDQFMTRGENIYKRVCLVCHQSDGSGVPMMYPPVIESEYISGETDSLIVLILEGISGPVTVKGEEYNSIMPPQKDVLDNQEVADLINYLRKSFGNTGESVSPEHVARMRK
jgi:mono/diheme cytochrome c family protein